ncbi:MAG: PorV/PorQ family protein, partial [Candidatus Marinimicrobia bacterium]|nr:PorV/PorQ family protein [Candidatus Neomarinimicrobiota bacterium]
TAAQFLKIGIGARGTAMGGAFAAIDGDISSMYWNAAGIASMNRLETMFVDGDWLAGVRLQYLGFSIPIHRIGVLGLSVTNLSVPEDKVRTISEPEGTGEYWGARDLAANLSFARKLSDKFSIGGNIKYIQQTIWHASASTYAADLGALFETPFNGIRLGASINNYGGKMKLEGRDQKISVDPDPLNQGNVEFINANLETDQFPIPLIFRVGLSGELINKQNLRLSYAIDALHPNDNSEYVNLGMETVFNNLVSIRAGYPSLYKEESIEGPTFGAGLNYRIWRTATILKVDYSFADFGPLGDVKRISIGFNF